jgi:hypothetical protein
MSTTPIFEIYNTSPSPTVSKALRFGLGLVRIRITSRVWHREWDILYANPNEADPLDNPNDLRLVSDWSCNIMRDLVLAGRETKGRPQNGRIVHVFATTVFYNLDLTVSRSKQCTKWKLGRNVNVHSFNETHAGFNQHVNVTSCIRKRSVFYVTIVRT